MNTAIFRCYCVQSMKVLDIGKFGETRETITSHPNLDTEGRSLDLLNDKCTPHLWCRPSTRRLQLDMPHSLRHQLFQYYANWTLRVTIGRSSAAAIGGRFAQ